MTDCSVDRRILELLAAPDAAQEQPSPAHVAPPDEGGRKEEPLPEDREQRIDILRRSDAAEEHDFAIRRKRAGEEPRRLEQRFAEARIGLVDRNLPEGEKLLPAHEGFRRDETRSGRDDQHARDLFRRSREPLRVGKLAAEVEAAREGEGLAERSRPGPYPLREVELRRRAQEHLHALAAS